jgi:hypothetical protein
MTGWARVDGHDENHYVYILTNDSLAHWIGLT